MPLILAILAGGLALGVACHEPRPSAWAEAVAVLVAILLGALLPALADDASMGLAASFATPTLAVRLTRVLALAVPLCGYNRIQLVDPEGLAAFTHGDDEG